MGIKNLLLIYLCFASYSVSSGEIPQFHQPILSPEEAFQYVQRHLGKEKINLDKNKLTSLGYSFGPQKWIAQYTLSSDNNSSSFKTLNIYLSDEYPCDYEIFRR